MSAGFESVQAVNLLRKHQVGFGFGSQSLMWLASYLEERKTYVSVEAEISQSRSMGKGIPQRGPLCPSLWQGYLGELPEAGKLWWGILQKVVTEAKREDRKLPEEELECALSQTIGSKPHELLTPEELYEQRMRDDGT